ncbi:MAG: TIGR02266 family protein [Myxococcales bacterium]|nr:TIGR02266 family protein [Myxococcales bacterium]
MADQDDKEKQGRDRRDWRRVLVDLEVDYGNADNFLFSYISDISETGIFIRTNTPEKPGTRLNLRFMPNDGNRQILQLEGEVIWVNGLRPENPDNLNPGMGVNFVDLDRDSRHRLVEYIKTFAFLEDPKEEDPSDQPRNDERTN